MRCKCKGTLIQKSLTGGYDLRITGKVTVDALGLHAQCFWCKSAVTLPLEMKASAGLDSLPSRERFVIKKK